MPAGRPTTYSQDIVEQAKEYLANYNDEKYGDVIPSVEGLAKALDRARSTIYFWAEDKTKPEFLDILDKINEEQKRVLITKGLSGDFNSNITKLVLGKHGMHDVQEVDLKAQIDHTVKEQINFDAVREKVIQNKEKLLN